MYSLSEIAEESRIPLETLRHRAYVKNLGVLKGKVRILEEFEKHIILDSSLFKRGKRKSSEKNYQLTLGELFAGIGGIGLGFQQAGFKILWANEIDQKASLTYKKNFNHLLINKDMREVDPHKLKGVDILTGGFPCQPFSIAGNRKGFEDERGNLFFDLIRYIEVIQPQAIFLENVKNLSSHDKGNTFNVIQDKLSQVGYYCKSQVLNTAEYSEIPQNRERLYIVGFKDKEHCNNFKFPNRSKKRKTISNFLEKEVPQDFYYTNSLYYPQLEKGITNSHTIYQWRRVYLRENKNNLCPTLTANMGTGGHNVPLVKDSQGIRKLTPRECAKFQGFPDDFILPSDEIARSALYKQIGNSVSVPIVKMIAEEIKRVLMKK